MRIGDLDSVLYVDEPCTYLFLVKYEMETGDTNGYDPEEVT